MTKAGHVRDIRACLDVRPNEPVEADLNLFIAYANLRRLVLLLAGHDPTGSIRCRIERARFSEDEWSLIRKIGPGDRVRLTGPVRCEQIGDRVLPVLTAESVAVLIRETRRSGDHATDWGAEVRGLASPFMLARLRNAVATVLRGHEFDEIEPSYLSINSTGRVRALEVMFPGVGAPVALCPSPAEQLLEFVLSGFEKVFAVARCFSDSIRDGFTSAESLIVCAMLHEPSYETLVSLAKMLVEDVFREVRTQLISEDLADSGELRKWSETHEWDQVIASTAEIFHKEYLRPTVVRVSDPPREPSTSEGRKITDLFALVWPPHIALVEGHREQLGTAIVVGGITLHLERMLAQLVGPSPLRNLRRPTQMIPRALRERRQ